MNQKATRSAEIAQRGRPIKFDRATVIDRAVDVFWEKGFDSTPLDDLVDRLGISRSTLYNSFGGKDGVHRAALDRYLDRVERVVVEPLRSGTDGVADVIAFVDRVADVLTSSDMPAGCLVLNDMAADRNRTAVDRYLSGLRGAIRSGLSRAAALGEIDESTIDAKTSVTVSTVIAANHVASAGLGIEATELTDGLRTLMLGWAAT